MPLQPESWKCTQGVRGCCGPVDPATPEEAGACPPGQSQVRVIDPKLHVYNVYICARHALGMPHRSR